MRQYVVDQLTPEEQKRIKDYLDKYCESAGLDGMYWLHIPKDICSKLQKQHKECQPHCVGIELRRRDVRFEFLVRSRNKIRCKCISYANKEQRDYIVDFIEDMLKKNGIKA